MNMVKVKTAELEVAQLDWAVAKALGIAAEMNFAGGVDTTQLDCRSVGIPDLPVWCGAFGHGSIRFRPSTDWSQGGPIIERERITLVCLDDGRWISGKCSGTPTSPLIAAMRAFVASKLGDTVEVPV